MLKEVALTADGQAKLEQELHHLETVRRREVGERIREAKDFGDISENSEYDDAKNEQAWVEGRISEISQILANATIIESPARPTQVTFGARVHLKDAETGDMFVYQLVGSAEADPTNDKISNESPVGQAIMGAKKGDVVSVTTPRGTQIKYEVASITK
ncbi:MAG: transcription elongation factor GreA [Coriobacteriia bacterium]|nr:transcription elongation factor GreA [Coriobacteriia bacterium]